MASQMCAIDSTAEKIISMISLKDLDGLLLARLWPPQRVVVGMRASRWVREQLVKNIDWVWLNYRPKENTMRIMPETVGMDFARLEHGFVDVELMVQACTSYHHVNALLQGVTHAWKMGWEGAILSLDLSGSDLGPSGVNSLASLLFENCSLRSLSLAGNGIGDKRIELLADMLAGCKALSHLDLSDNEIRDQGAQQLAEALGECESLTSLFLDGNFLKDEGAEHLVGGLRHCTSLRHLSLKRNIIGDFGAGRIAYELERCRDLQDLDLSYNRIGDKGAGLIESLMSECRVVLWGNDSTKEEGEDRGETDEYRDSEDAADDDDESSCWGLASPGTDVRARWRRSGGTWTRYGSKKACGW